MWRALIERWHDFSKEQRISVVVLGVCGGLAVGLSLYRLHASIREPFLTDKATALAFKQGLAPTDEDQEARQRRIDTDGDSISDWDEINISHTNPNLKDSCGDGMADNIRILTGKNLNCASKRGNPSGAFDTSGVEATSTQLLQNQLGGPNPDAIVSDFAQAALRAQATGATGDASTSIVGRIPRDPKAIRSALAGKVDQAKLDAVSDEELLRYYDMALAEQRASYERERASSTSSP